jgi:hypothetical protein
MVLLVAFVLPYIDAQGLDDMVNETVNSVFRNRTRYGVTLDDPTLSGQIPASKY